MSIPGMPRRAAAISHLRSPLPASKPAEQPSAAIPALRALSARGAANGVVDRALGMAVPLHRLDHVEHVVVLGSRQLAHQHCSLVVSSSTAVDAIHPTVGSRAQAP